MTLTDEQIDAAYDALLAECLAAGEIPPTLPTFARALLSLADQLRDKLRD